MSTRLTTTAAIATMGIAVTLLSACGATAGSGGGAGSTVSPTTTASASASATPSTATSTTGPTPTVPPTSTSPGKPNTTMSIPPPAKDPVAIPSTPKAYGQAFVSAWVDRDRDDAVRLGTTSAVATAFDSTAKTAPKFAGCEGAAGSSYCTWQGDEYTMIVRVGNEAATQQQQHAVTEVRFTH